MGACGQGGGGGEEGERTNEPPPTPSEPQQPFLLTLLPLSVCLSVRSGVLRAELRDLRKLGGDSWALRGLQARAISNLVIRAQPAKTRVPELPTASTEQ